jgi:homoserine O-acetyltransferase/O-succinyltransferase
MNHISEQNVRWPRVIFTLFAWSRIKCKPMDPNDLLAMAWKWQRGDVSRNTGGDLASALGRIKAKTYVMPISHDMFFPPGDCEVEQRLIPGSQFRPLKSICGHLGLFGVDPELLAQLDINLNELLETPLS